MSLLFFCCTVVYALLLAAVCIALLLQRVPDNRQIQGISVIIAARNEADKLPRLLESVSRLDYALYEVIIVNDHSTDASQQILSAWEGKQQIRMIEFQHEIPGLTGKKAAQQMGINAARHEILAFTDADCVLPPSWLSEINKSMDPDTDYLLGYSIIKRSEGDSELRLQNFERGIYYALAAAGLYWRKPVTSSGCNMIYRKSLFLKAGGFEGIGHLRSGDDDLLLMKMMPQIRKAVFNPSLALQILSISGQDSYQQHQTNIRRASKFQYFPLWLKALALFVFLYFGLFYAGLSSLLWLSGQSVFILSLALKTGAELCLILLQFSRIGHPKLSACYPLQILLFPAQFIFYALRGTFGSYQWK